MRSAFKGNFTQQEPIPEEAVAAACNVLKHGRLHRYNIAEGEFSEASLLEREFSEFVGSRFCLALASGGYAISCALRAIGVSHGARVLTNAFTLAPVPGAIASVGAVPVLVDTLADLVIDLEDLASKSERTGANVLLLSHMRGHICDMDALVALSGKLGLTIIEDCAHTMGATWNGVPSGKHGKASCYSTQTYKHINSGEGGLLVTDDPSLMAKAVMLSGSYMLYDRHLAGPPPEAYSEVRLTTPNMSGRMDNLRSAILRPQLIALEDRCVRWNERYRLIERRLQGCSHIQTIHRPEKEGFVGSSIQFGLPRFSSPEIESIVSGCKEQGVELKWFGRGEPDGFTSRHDNWHYLGNQDCPRADEVLRSLLDMRIPLTFSLEDCVQISDIICSVVDSAPVRGPTRL